jgi:hypothetical protein
MSNIKPSKPAKKATVVSNKDNRNTGTKIAFSVGRGLGMVVSALAAVGEAELARDAEAREIDREIRELQERQANLYGRTTLTPLFPVGHGVRWSHQRPAHLINCRVSCTDKHCIDCGERVYGSSVRCLRCY